jgi:hypothetical protein
MDRGAALLKRGGLSCFPVRSGQSRVEENLSAAREPFVQPSCDANGGRVDSSIVEAQQVQVISLNRVAHHAHQLRRPAKRRERRFPTPGRIASRARPSG